MDGSGNDVIDRAIDETARGLTAGEPGAAFTTRVMARVRHRPARTWRVAMNPLTIVAAVAIAVVVVMMRISNVRPAVAPEPAPAIAGAGSQQQPALSADAFRADAQLKPSTLAPRASADELRSTTSSSSQLALSRSLRAPSHSSGAASGGAPSFVASLAPPPLDVPPIVLPSLDADASLDVAAMVPLEPMVLAPLDQPEGDQP